jgi:ribose transport system substrate-binding protein
MNRPASLKASRLAALSAAALVAMAAAGCSTSTSSTPSGNNTTTAATTPNKITISGDVTFNQTNLNALDAKLIAAMKGKSMSSVKIAMVVNIAADYWKAGQAGFTKGCSDAGISSADCIYYAPPTGQLASQISELSTLRSQGLTGYSISAIDPAALATGIKSDVAHGTNVLAIDSPLPTSVVSTMYLGTPNYEAGFKAGTAMKQALGGKGSVAILVGSLTATNAIQRIQGFKDALKGTSISVVDTENDNGSAATAQSDAETILANHADVNGLYGVYSYDGPALATAVKSGGKSGKVAIICDDADPATVSALQSGTIGATIVQMPYMQGYTGALLLAADKVLGKSAVASMVKSYLASDGMTLSSGVGVLTQGDLSAYQSLASSLGISG